jgi:uncharacterized repeat protein (TIGR03803 family)
MGTFTILASFGTGRAGGSYPITALVQATDGNLYGTSSDGYEGLGTVFKITTKGVFTTLYKFCPIDCSDGRNPQGALIQGTDGSLYGTTTFGGNMCYLGCGVVFKITTSGKLTTLYKFCSQTDCADGAHPHAGLVQGADGNLYGTTFDGGSGGCTDGNGTGCGTAFKITLEGKLTTLHRFDSVDGNYPSDPLIQGTDGNIYGTTDSGGNLACNPSYGCGTIFQITSGTLTTLHSFDSTDGAYAWGGLLQSTNGGFYGTTVDGGNLTCNSSYGCGTVFSLNMGLGPFVAFVRNSGRVGQTGGILGQGFTGTTGVSLNGIPASFTVVSDTFIRATVPPRATTGFVTVTTPSGVLTSNVPFRVLP